MYVFPLHVCMCTICISGAHGGQKRALNPQEISFQIVVSHHVNVGNQIPIMWESSQFAFQLPDTF